MNNLDLTTDQKIKIAQIKQELLTPAEINPANDLTGPEKVDLAIICS